jgi:hypothetical protein
MKDEAKRFPFTPTYKSLTEVMIDHELAALGDAYANFVHSLALSNRKGKPAGAKAKGTTLAQALRKAGLREHLPSRMSSHTLADAAEALLAYAWLHNQITLEESAAIVNKSNDAIEGFTQLLITAKNRINLS